MNLVVVLEGYRKKDNPTQRQEVEIRPTWQKQAYCHKERKVAKKYDAKNREKKKKKERELTKKQRIPFGPTK